MWMVILRNPAKLLEVRTFQNWRGLYILPAELWLLRRTATELYGANAATIYLPRQMPKSYIVITAHSSIFRCRATIWFPKEGSYLENSSLEKSDKGEMITSELT